MNVRWLDANYVIKRGRMGLSFQESEGKLAAREEGPLFYLLFFFLLLSISLSGCAAMMGSVPYYNIVSE